jgi:hypothetical protein
MILASRMVARREMEEEMRTNVNGPRRSIVTRTLAALVMAGVLGAAVGSVAGGGGDDGAMPFRPKMAPPSETPVKPGR